MGIMAAGMTDTGMGGDHTPLTHKVAFRLLNGKAIDIRPQCHRVAGAACIQRKNTACIGHLFHGKAQFFGLRLNECDGFILLTAAFRDRVQMPAALADIGFLLRRQTEDRLRVFHSHSPF